MTSGDSVQANNGTLTALDNSVITATAERGTLKTIAGLSSGEMFTFGGATYTQTEVGLMRGGNSICEKLGTSSIKVSDLSSGTFVKVLAVDNEYLDLTSVNTNANVYNDAEKPAVKYAELTVKGTTFTLNDSGSASSAIETVGISNSTILNIDFTTNVSTSGIVTVNDNKYTAVGDIVISAVEDDSSLYGGTVSLTNNESVKGSNGTLTVVNGTVSATASKGILTTIDGLAADESFTFGGSTYTQTAAGLTTGGIIREDLKTSTIRIADLSAATWENYVQTDSDDVLTLSKVTVETANVYNSAMSSPRLATVSMSSATYTLTDNADNDSDIKSVKLDANKTLTVDFVTYVTGAKNSSVTVNGAAYTGATAFTIDTTADDSELYEGTVSIGENATVTANDITINGVSGTITATALSGTWTQLGSLDSGDEFIINGKTYQIKGTDSLIQIVSGEGDKLYTEYIVGGTVDYSKLIDSNFCETYELDENSVLDLTAKPLNTDPTIVVGHSAPNIRVADLIYSASAGYKLSSRSDGDITKLAGIK
ncbi:MAG: hypothetical protein IKD80_06130, partial [Selenomonadaceae bacterium]|nr:hypothetical protein [Selenomonadaceae bacterium]